VLVAKKALCRIFDRVPFCSWPGRGMNPAGGSRRITNKKKGNQQLPINKY